MVVSIAGTKVTITAAIVAATQFLLFSKKLSVADGLFSAGILERAARLAR
jgi:hypothetical protein